MDEEIAASEAYRDDTALKTIIQGKRNVGWFVKIGGAYITHENILKQVKKHNLKILPVEGSDYGAYIVYRPEGEQDALELKKIAEKYGGYLSYRATDEDTRRIGELLGYRKEDIDAFIKERNEKLAKKDLAETYKGKRTDNGAPGTFKAKITKAYGGDVTIEKAKKFKNRENATALDKQQANWFINFHSKNENLNEEPYTSGEPADAPIQTNTIREKLEPYLVEITKYMYKQGLNIDPAPEIEFVEDEENAQNVLGRTAYYDPNNKVIVLYITGRHPKDILRSFAHEMIHHMQNLEGRLENMSGTTNVNEDDYLADIEREAYDNGNMIFRSWENDREGNNSIHNMRGFTPGSYDMQPSDTN